MTQYAAAPYALEEPGLASTRPAAALRSARRSGVPDSVSTASATRASSTPSPMLVISGSPSSSISARVSRFSASRVAVKQSMPSSRADHKSLKQGGSEPASLPVVNHRHCGLGRIRLLRPHEARHT